jgi:ribosomal protein S18 acetylase RimI-like enzyme
MSRIELNWGMAGREADHLASFFVRHITPLYISHGEIQSGRAQSATSWSTDLKANLVKEFSSISPADGPLAGDGKYIFTGLETAEKDNLACLGLVELHSREGTVFALLADLIVRSDLRNRSIGRSAMTWLERELAICGVRWIFLESGVQNITAHRFFTSVGFRQCSITMSKELSGGTSTIGEHNEPK